MAMSGNQLGFRRDGEADGWRASGSFLFGRDGDFGEGALGMFSNLSSSSISLATVTPSLVTRCAP